jgi:hypothetical protein
MLPGNVSGYSVAEWEARAKTGATPWGAPMEVVEVAPGHVVQVTVLYAPLKGFPQAMTTFAGAIELLKDIPGRPYHQQQVRLWMGSVVFTKGNTGTEAPYVVYLCPRTLRMLEVLRENPRQA